MGQYGFAAIRAVRALQENEDLTPREAWEQAMERTSKSKASQDKGCPRGAFLGLCAAGMIVDVDPDPTVFIGENGKYAIAAVEVLREDPSFARSVQALWDEAKPRDDISHAGQMDVVRDLWEVGLIRKD